MAYLPDYARKRDFSRTREPQGRERRSGRARFVVQLHHARRRHYDLRLQVGDRLKSWAVPKGPSLDPSVSRLAVEVEDHPLDYADFAGTIAAGNYGAGHVARFDHGYWSSAGNVDEQLAKGHLRFELFGGRLRGGWHLVRSGGVSGKPRWLLVKDDDEWAAPVDADDLAREGGPSTGRAGTRRQADGVRPRPSRGAPRDGGHHADRQAALALPGARAAALPSGAPQPQLARLVTRPPSGPGWMHELKWDGYRVLARIDADQVTLWSRNGLEWTDRLPEIADALRLLDVRSAVLDGELVAGSGRRDDFNRLQATLAGERHDPLSLVLFDLLHLDGVDVRGAALQDRRRLLQELLGRSRPARLAFSSHVDGDGIGALAPATRQGFEGIVSKRADAPYAAGRGGAWRKCRQVQGEGYAVVGWTPPQGSRQGFGSLLLVRPDAAGTWHYAGRVGSGFTDAMIARISRLVAKGGSSRPSVRLPAGIAVPRACWFAPRFVVEVNLRGLASSGLLRQASFKALREDMKVDDLHVGNGADAGGQGGPRLTHPERVVFPDDGYTKADVAGYYTKVMDHLLPEIAGRPLSVVRCPDGLAGQCFFQKHHGPGLEGVGKLRLREESGRWADYLVIEDAADVMALVQMNVIEFHPWGARADDPDLCDRMVFDLDPGPGVAWIQVKAAARLVRHRLREAGLESFLRTSGGKGLHVVVPLRPRCAWPQVKRFARAFAAAMASSAPERYVDVATMARRKGRIFVDYLRNSRGATSVASYSLRARPGAPVAVPVRWAGLARLQSPAAWTIVTLPRRLARLGSDPWEGIGDLEQDLSHWST